MALDLEDLRTRPVRAEPLPELSGTDPAVVAEGFRDLSGLALLESGRPGRQARWTYLAADPVAMVELRPALAGSIDAPSDPFVEARAALRRLAPEPVETNGGPPLCGGLLGYLAYDLGRRFEALPSFAPDDQGLPLMRLGLYDWTIAWDRRSGRAWLAGRAVDGEAAALDRRLGAVRRRLRSVRRSGGRGSSTGEAREVRTRTLRFTSNLDREAYAARVGTIREAIAAGEIYQANLARRLAAPFSDDAWPLYRRLRAGDPATHAAYLDLAAGRALLSASPEPFLRLTPSRFVASDPIKGTRPRGHDRVEDRRLLGDLLRSAKDRAENVMIVDVLRNDLGRVCLPGSVTAPRLCRPERSGAVQHLVSTVTGTLRPEAEAFALLTAAFPGASITGAPKLRAMAILDGLEPVRRGPYSGAIGWIGPDGAMAMSIAIRTFVADGRRLTLHVGGGITWRSDPAAEWDETVAKARGPLDAVGGQEVEPHRPRERSVRPAQPDVAHLGDIVDQMADHGRAAAGLAHRH